MITKNFKALLAVILQSAGNTDTNGLLPIKSQTGTTIYLSFRQNGFPYSVYNSVSIASSASNNGIRLGTGNTQATENDYNLESRITSGLTASSPAVTYDVDENGNPYKEFLFTLTNTTNSDITVAEIGYFQQVYTSTSKGANTSTTTIMLDRTVLSTPVTVPANDSAAIKYTLKTIMPS